jgi:hypothetical protein
MNDIRAIAVADPLPDALRPSASSDGFPICVQCERAVDSVDVETPTEIIAGAYGSAMGHTGEVIMTVRCHGEKWRISNWRGVF